MSTNELPEYLISAFDRLMDDSPENQTEQPMSPTMIASIQRKSIRRDLEDLLNSKLQFMELSEGLDEVRTSVYHYGIPDLTSINFIKLDSLDQFCQDIEAVIRKFEPRFKSVKVIPHSDSENRVNRTIRFRIDALMISDPAPEAIVFDSVLETTSRNVALDEVHHV